MRRLKEDVCNADVAQKHDCLPRTKGWGRSTCTEGHDSRLKTAAKLVTMVAAFMLTTIIVNTGENLETLRNLRNGLNRMKKSVDSMRIEVWIKSGTGI